MTPTRKMKSLLEGNGCKFRRRGKVWACFLDGIKVSSNKYLGELVWDAAKALGEN